MTDDTKWTLVTGAAKRLGAAIVTRLADAGHAIAIHYNTSESEARQLLDVLQKKGVTAALIQGSFESQESTADFISRYQKQFVGTKYLVNNVGNYILESALETSPQTVQSLFQTNVFAPLALAQALMDSIILEQGAIVNIGVSGLAGVKADVESTVFTMTKQSLLGLTKSLAKELGSLGVRVNMVSPGRLENSIDHTKGVRSIAMQRMGSVEEVAHAVAFLLDDESRYITGQNIDVAGGLNL